MTEAKADNTKTKKSLTTEVRDTDSTSLYCSLLLLAVAFNTIPRWLLQAQSCKTLAHFNLEAVPTKALYYKGDALSFLFIVLACRCNKENTSWSNTAYNLILGLVANNVLDELFFDPLTFGINEEIFGLTLFTWLVYRLIKKR